MDNDVLATQYVQFIARGLDDVSLVTDEYRRRLEQTNTAADLLNKTISSGAYEDIARRTHAASQEMRTLTDRAREIEYAVRGGLNGEVAEKFAAKLANARKEADLLQASLSSGQFAGFASQMAAEAKRLESLKAQAQSIQNRAAGIPIAQAVAPFVANPVKQQTLWAEEYRQKITTAHNEAAKAAFLARLQYGNLGASLIDAGNKTQALGQRMSLLGTAGAIAFGTLTASAVGFARQGLSGTVEGFILTENIQIFARQVTALFLPAIRAITGGLQHLNAVLRDLNGDQQNHVRMWGLAAAGAAGFTMLLPRAVSGIGSLTASIGRLGPLLTGVAPGLAGLFGTGAAGGPVGLAIAAGVALVAAELVAVAGAFAIAYARSAEFRAEVAKVGSELRRLYQEAEPLIEAGLELITQHMIAGFRVLSWEIQRVTATLRVMKQLADSFPNLSRFSAFGALYSLGQNTPRGGSGKERDDVSPMGTGFENFGAQYDRLASAITKAEVASMGMENKTAEEATADYTEKIWTLLYEWVNRQINQPNPPPFGGLPVLSGPNVIGEILTRIGVR